MDRLSNIIAFITVAETKSFAETARRLNLANSVVSKRVKDLEDYLGVRLLQRSTRSVTLTDAGYTYFDSARRLVDELAETEEQLRFQNENPVGEVKVSAPMTFTNMFLAPVLSSFLVKYPDVSLRMLISEHPLHFANDEVDVGIMIGNPREQSLTARKIAQTRRVVVASPAYLEKHGRPQTPEDLKRHNCMSYTRLGDGKSWPFRNKQGKDFWQPVGGRYVCDSGPLLCEAALEGCGIVILPSFIVGRHVVDGKLEILLEEYEQDPMAIQIVYPPQRHLSARVRKFIDHVAAHFADFGRT